MLGPGKCSQRCIRALGVAIAALVLFTGCEVDARVDVRIAADGRGTVGVRVVLDAAAVSAAEIGGGTLDDRIPLTDLVSAGWTRTEWERRADGSAAIEISKPFASVDEVAGLMEELSGPVGPIQGASASRDESWWSTTTNFVATLDLQSSTAGVANDVALAERLAAAGVDPATVDAALSGRARGAVTVRLGVELPDGVGDEWTARTDAVTRAEVSSTTRHVRPLGLMTVGAALFLAAAYLLVVGEWRAARRRRSREAVVPRS